MVVFLLSGCTQVHRRPLQDIGSKSLKMSQEVDEVERLLLKNKSKLRKRDRKKVQYAIGAVRSFINDLESFVGLGNPTDDDIGKIKTAYSKMSGAYKIVFHGYSEPRTWQKLPKNTRDKLTIIHHKLLGHDHEAQTVYKVYRNQLNSQEAAENSISVILKGLKMVLL